MNEPSTEKVYRLRRDQLIIGVVCTLFFLVMGIGSAAGAYWNIDGSFPNPELAALIFGSFWSVVMMLSLWLILTYYRERLLITETTITQNGIIRTKTIHIDTISRIKWRRLSHNGFIVIQTATQKMRIYLDDFTKEDRKDIVAFMRDSIACDLQVNWSQFYEFTHKTTIPPKAISPRSLIVLAMIWFAFSGIFVYCWWIELGTKHLVIGVMNSLLALWYLWRLKHRPDKT